MVIAIYLEMAHNYEYPDKVRQDKERQYKARPYPDKKMYIGLTVFAH